MNRTLTLLFTIACTSISIIDLPMEIRGLSAYAQTSASSPQPSQVSEEHIKSKAEKITIRVYPKISQDNYKASGILIDKQERKQGKQVVYLYLVLTNDHVLEGLKKRADGGYQVQTYDGQIHDALPYPQANFQGNDLGLLWFYSTNNYEKAQLGKSTTLKQDEQVFVAGFPCEDANSCQGEFTFTSGTVFNELISANKHLDAGYQIGFTNDTKDGMSGSPVLDEKGLVVGINGRGKHQDLGLRSADPSVPDINPYAYMDGTEPPAETQERLKEFAWAIPIETYIKYQPKKPFDILVNTLQVLPIKDVKQEPVSQSDAPTQNNSISNPTNSKPSEGSNKTSDIILFFIVFLAIEVLILVIIYFLLKKFKPNWLRRFSDRFFNPYNKQKPVMQIQGNNKQQANYNPNASPQLQNNITLPIAELRINQNQRIVNLLVAGNRYIIYGKLSGNDFVISNNPTIIVKRYIPESKIIQPIIDNTNYKLNHIRTIQNQHGDEEEHYNLTLAGVAPEQSDSIVLSFTSQSSTELQS